MEFHFTGKTVKSALEREQADDGKSAGKQNIQICPSEYSANTRSISLWQDFVIGIFSPSTTR